MGKFLESMGKIDGYNMVEVGKMKAKKDELFEEIEKVDSKIKEKTRKIVNGSSGLIFAVVKDKRIKGIYLFEDEKKEQKKNLKHVETVYIDEVKEDVREKYENFLLEQLKDYVQMQEYEKVILEDKVIQIDPTKSKKERTIAIIGGFLVGFLFGWCVFEGVVGGICYGIIFAPIFSGLEVVISNKRGRKKSKDNK